MAEKLILDLSITFDTGYFIMLKILKFQNVLKRKRKGFIIPLNTISNFRKSKSCKSLNNKDIYSEKNQIGLVEKLHIFTAVKRKDIL